MLFFGFCDSKGRASSALRSRDGGLLGCWLVGAAGTAASAAWKPIVECVRSQKGLFIERAAQRERALRSDTRHRSSRSTSRCRHRRDRTILSDLDRAQLPHFLWPEIRRWISSSPFLSTQLHPSTGDSGCSTLRSTQMRFGSSLAISSSSFRVPLFCTSIDGTRACRSGAGRDGSPCCRCP